MTSIAALIGCGQEAPYGREESIPESYRDPASPKSIEKSASRDRDKWGWGLVWKPEESNKSSFVFLEPVSHECASKVI